MCEEGLLKTIKTRRSIRQFQRKEIPLSAIEEILEAGRLAPTANNLQPWKFVVVLRQEVRTWLAEITDYGHFIKEAPVCIAVFCENTKYYLEDGCAATENILLAAWALGIGSCWVAGDKKKYADQIRTRLQLPPFYKLVSLIALGYPQHYSDNLRGKKKLKEIVQWVK